MHLFYFSVFRRLLVFIFTTGLQIYNLNNDRLTVGFLSRKCGSYFNESQVHGICKAVVSLLGKLFFIDVNLEMMQCRD